MTVVTELRGEPGEEAGGPQVPRAIDMIDRLHALLRRELSESLEARGLTRAQLTTLAVLRASPGLSNAQLARRSVVSPQAMSEITKALAARGLIARGTSASRKRSVSFAVSEAGQAALNAATPCLDAAEQQMLAGMSVADRSRLVQDLHACIARLGGRA